MAAALLTNRSSRPLSSTTRSNSAATAASSLWSTGTAIPPSPGSVTVLPVRYTRQPWATSAAAMPRPAPRLAPVTTATACELCATDTKLRRRRHRFVDHWQLPIAYRLDDRVSQSRTGKEQAPARVRGQVLGLSPLEAARGRLGIPLHAGLIPAALAHQYRRTAAPACHRHHRRVGESVVWPDRHQVVPAADLSARLPSTTF